MCTKISKWQEDTEIILQKKMQNKHKYSLTKKEKLQKYTI